MTPRNILIDNLSCSGSDNQRVPQDPGVNFMKSNSGLWFSSFLNIRVSDIQRYYKEWKKRGGLSRK